MSEPTTPKPLTPAEVEHWRGYLDSLKPTTAAGRALWESMTGGVAMLDGPFQAAARHLGETLAAIEAEARAAALDEARAAVEAIRPVWLSGPDDKSVNLGQVIAAIDALREGKR